MNTLSPIRAIGGILLVIGAMTAPGYDAPKVTANSTSVAIDADPAGNTANTLDRLDS